MPTKPADKKGAKLPKARLMYVSGPCGNSQTLYANPAEGKPESGEIIVLMLECQSAATAKRRLKFERLSEEEKVEAIAQILAARSNSVVINEYDREGARSILRISHGDAKA